MTTASESYYAQKATNARRYGGERFLDGVMECAVRRDLPPEIRGWDGDVLAGWRAARAAHERGSRFYRDGIDDAAMVRALEAEARWRSDVLTGWERAAACAGWQEASRRGAAP